MPAISPVMSNFGPLAGYYRLGVVVQCRTCTNSVARADGKMDCPKDDKPVGRLERCWDFRREPGADDDVPSFFPFGRDRAAAPPGE